MERHIAGLTKCPPTRTSERPSIIFTKLDPANNAKRIEALEERLGLLEEYMEQLEDDLYESGSDDSSNDDSALSDASSSDKQPRPVDDDDSSDDEAEASLFASMAVADIMDKKSASQ
tara:strand:- start:223 stop:573 length:351 start_codon:yes stop_codon:yes gene_type:complete